MTLALTARAERITWLRAALRIGPPGRFVLAAAAVSAAALARHLLFAGQAPWFLFVPTTVLVALAFGAGPAVLATLLSAVAAGYDVSAPGRPFQLGPVQWEASVIFVAVTLGLVAVVRRLRATLVRMDALLAEQARDRAELAESRAFLSGVLASSTDCIKVLDLDGRLAFMSDNGMKAMEVSDFNQVGGCPWPSFWEGGGRAEALAALAAAREGRATSFDGPADTLAGTGKWWHVAVSPIAGADGRPERILSVSRDITALHDSEAELRGAEERLRLLNGELNHRLKNVLTVVQSVVSQTLRRATDTRTASEDLSARLAAMGAAADVLTAESWASAGLRGLAERTLAPHGEVGRRIRLDGPDLSVLPQVGLAFALAFHELATNAVKYGALSTDAGSVELGWCVEDGEGRSPRFHLHWRERGGPPVRPPERTGFGSTLIERSLRSYCQAKVEADYRPDGFVLSMDAPLGYVAQVEPA